MNLPAAWWTEEDEQFLQWCQAGGALTLEEYRETWARKVGAPAELFRGMQGGQQQLGSLLGQAIGGTVGGLIGGAIGRGF